MESNQRLMLTRQLLYHLTKRAWWSEERSKLYSHPYEGCSLPLKISDRNTGAGEGIRTLSDSLEGCVLSQENTRIKLADRSGIEPDSHGLTVRPHTVVRFGQ